MSIWRRNFKCPFFLWSFVLAFITAIPYIWLHEDILPFHGVSYRTYYKLQKVSSMASFILPSFFHRTDLRTISSTIAHSMLDDLSIQQQQQTTTTNQGASLFYTLWIRGDMKTFFLEGEKSFLVLLFKVYNKVEMSTTTNQGASLSRIDDNFTSTSSSLASASANTSGTSNFFFRSSHFCIN